MERDVCRILMVEDNPGDARLLREHLRDAPSLVCSVTHVERVADARARLADGAVDVVLLDLSLPDAQGLETVRRVHEAAPDVPIVVLTGLDDEATALQAVQAGAQDYLVKGQVDGGLLARAVRYAVERQRLLTAAQRATRARDEVLGIVSHDLRNPLAAIGMCASALTDDALPAHPDIRRLAETIQHSAGLMNRIIEDLLDVASIEAGRLSVSPRAHSVAQLLAEAQELFLPQAAERSLRLTIQAGDRLPAVRVDRDRVMQLLSNLVGNAVKFTAEGGVVTIRADRRDGFVHVSVSDTGPGIPPDHLPHIFDRFWQAARTRRGGAGLGLAIARGIVRAHGGEIWVESEVGRGTVFHFTLPTVATPAQELRGPTDAADASARA